MVSKGALAHLGTEPLSTEPYISAQYFELERARIFRRVWLYAARVEEFARPGDFMVRPYEVCNANILIVRGKDEQIRAFHNVCTHRQAKLVWEARGNAPRFSCHYHGWGFGLDGRLRSVPDSESFYSVSPETCGLTPVHLEIWRGFIFVNFAREPEQSLPEYLSPIATKLADHAFAGCTSTVMLSGEVAVNWKAMLDNFQETYHLGFIHARTVGDRGVNAQNPFGHPLSFEFFGPHRYMSIWGNPGHAPAPIEAMAGRSGGISGAGAAQQTEHYKKIRPANWQLDVHGIFPNLLIEVSPTFFYTIEINPIAVDRTRVVTRHFLPKAQTPGERFSQEYNMAAFRDTVAEDIGVLSSIQASMRSGARGIIHFQAHEALCRHAYRTVESYVAGTPPQPVE